MAVAEIYSEGRGIFDAMPYIKAIEAKKAARKAAANNYFKDIFSKVNTAGVRTIDLPGLNNQIKDWQSYGIDNSKAIMQGNTAEAAKFQEMQRDIVYRAEQSKSNIKTADELNTLRLAGKIKVDDDFMEKMNRIGMSIYEPAHYKDHFVTKGNYNENRGTEFGLGDFQPPISELTEKDAEALIKIAEGDMKPDFVADPQTKKIKFQVIDKDTRLYPKEYSITGLLNGAEKMGMFVEDAPETEEGKKIRTYYLDKLENPAFKAKADEVFQKYYKKNVETPREAAMAQFLMKNRQVEPEKTRISHQGKISIGGGGSGDTDYKDYYSIIDNNIKVKGLPVTTDGSVKYIGISDLPQSLSAVVMMSVKDQGFKEGDYTPQDLFAVRGKDGSMKIYEYDENGNATVGKKYHKFNVDKDRFNTLPAQGQKAKIKAQLEGFEGIFD